MTEQPGKPAEEQTVEYVLKILNDDAAIVSVIYSFTNPDGTTTKNPPQDFRYSKYFNLPAGKKAEDYGKPENTEEEMKETIEILGKQIEAIRYKSRGRTEAGPTEILTWQSDEVPGGRAKYRLVVVPVKRVTTAEITELVAAPADKTTGKND